MRIVRVALEPYRLALREPLRTARATLWERRGIVLRVRFSDGIEGLGEAAPLPGFGGEPLGQSWRTLETLATRLRGAQLDTDGLEAVAGALIHAPAARAALEVAALDAAGQRCGQSVAERLADEPAGSVAVNALLDAETPSALAAQARARRAQGFATLKLKVGGRLLARDGERVRAVRDAVGPAVAIRLDANGAWSEAEAARALECFEAAQPELVEEPLVAATPEAWARLRRRSATRLAADESLRCEADAARLLEAGAVDVLVLKPAWLGGLRGCLRIASRAASEGIVCAVTSALDSAIGRAAALHLAAALDGPLASGLATGDRLASDLARLPEAVAGRMALPAAAGLGLEMPAPAAPSAKDGCAHPESRTGRARRP